MSCLAAGISFIAIYFCLGLDYVVKFYEETNLMKYTIFYRDLTSEYRAEKSGFSFWAFLFGWIWLAINGLWIRALWCLTLYTLSSLYPLIMLIKKSFSDPISLDNFDMILDFTMKNVSMISANDYIISFILITISMIYVGSLGRYWINQKLEKNEFTEIGKQNGVSKEDAIIIAEKKLINHFSKYSNKIHDDWDVKKKLRKTKSNPLQNDFFTPNLIVMSLCLVVFLIVFLL